MTDQGDVADQPVTVALTRHARPGREADFEQFLRDINAAAARYPGHRGAEITRPAEQGSPYRVVFRFDSAAHLRAWEESAERAAWYRRGDEVSDDAPQVQRQTGLETWFTAPASPAPPSRLRMTAVIWLAIYPMTLLTAVVAGPLLAPLPLALSLLVQTAVTVPLLSYVVLPWLTRLLARWLHPAPVDSRPTRGADRPG